jgi:uncharacterized protein (DUF362 family)
VNLDTRRVAVTRTSRPEYPDTPPFCPGESYPELAGVPVASAQNPVYAALREALYVLGLDSARYGTPDWNPLGDLIHPGERVLVKPNMVRHENHGPGGLACVVTHPSVVRPLLDYVLLALAGSGEVVVGDSPLQSCEFDVLLERTGMRAMVDAVAARADVPVHLFDFRLVGTVEELGLAGARFALDGDPNGLVPVDLGRRSLLSPHDAGSHRYRVTGYDAEATPEHHGGGKHEYLLARSALDADVIVNVPKLKTHRKAGMTCALKNLVGLNGDKAWLPHHRAGATDSGGDEYRHASPRKALMSRLDYAIDMAGPGLRRAALRAMRKTVSVTNRLFPFPDPYREGSWHGNDTIWRTVLDINRAALHARGDGTFRDEPRRWLTVVDAVVCGENEGPLRPDPVAGGVLLAGFDQALVDLACARMIGFDPARLPVVREAFEVDHWPITRHRPEDLDVVPVLPGVPLRPSLGWLGHVESAGTPRREPAHTRDPYADVRTDIS